jgi:hypothetical protein
MTANRGLNQFVWDLRSSPATGETGVGPQLPSGRYTVRMTLGTTTTTQPLEIVPDPRTNSTHATEVVRYRLSHSLVATVAEMNSTLQKLRDARAQARSLAERAKASPNAELHGAIQTLMARIDSLERQLVVPPGGPSGPGQQTTLHTGNGFISEVSGLQNTIDNGFGPVTEGERWEQGDYDRQWAAIKGAANRVLMTDVPRVNALATAAGLMPGTSR